MSILEEKIDTKADKCLFDNACEKCDTYELCIVKECINDQIVFIEKNIRYCGYHLKFGNESVCACPKRRDIYLMQNK